MEKRLWRFLQLAESDTLFTVFEEGFVTEGAFLSREEALIKMRQETAPEIAAQLEGRTGLTSDDLDG
jgi:hypothetical protein